MRKLLLYVSALACLASGAIGETVKLGFNYPKTGPYAGQGEDQFQAAQLALKEINAAGGILGKKAELVITDSQSKADLSRNNARKLIDEDGVKMIFGGSSSGVAAAVSEEAQKSWIPYFGTLTYSNTVTGINGRRVFFRECYNAWMAGKVLSSYLKENYAGKKYFYITADYNWGHSTEASMRKFSDTEDTKAHRGVKTPFPGAVDADFRKALSLAKLNKPDVLVLVLFGSDMSNAIRVATAMGLKSDMQIVVPNLTLRMAEGAGPKVMEGVVGALPWTWQVPYKYGYERGQKFVEDFKAAYNRYPSTSGASAYTIIHEYKAAVERAGSFDGKKVIEALEGHEYSVLKDKQVWRDFDHQSVQTVYAVRCNPADVVKKDPFQLDYFEIITSLPGEEAARTFEEWSEARKSVGKPPHLEKF